MNGEFCPHCRQPMPKARVMVIGGASRLSIVVLALAGLEDAPKVEPIPLETFKLEAHAAEHDVYVDPPSKKPKRAKWGQRWWP